MCEGIRPEGEGYVDREERAEEKEATLRQVGVDSKKVDGGGSSGDDDDDGEERKPGRASN